MQWTKRTGRFIARLLQPDGSSTSSLVASAAAYADGAVFVGVNGALWSFAEP